MQGFAGRRGVSGDYYDFFPIGEGKLALLLADVSGKGMSAALLGASLQSAVRSNASSFCGETLAQANRLLVETTAADRYAAGFYAVYEPAMKKLTYSNGGHCPPMLIREGNCIRLDPLTPSVGMLSKLSPDERRIHMLPGDWLLRSRTEFRRQRRRRRRTASFVCTLSGSGAKELCEAVVAHVRNHLREQRQRYTGLT